MVRVLSSSLIAVLDVRESIVDVPTIVPRARMMPSPPLTMPSTDAPVAAPGRCGPTDCG